MRKLFCIISACVLCATIWAQSKNAAYQAYIDKYSHIAIEQQRKYDIPASITMAQALLESGAGQSELATKANNHFGIKCTSDWAGKTYKHNDNRANECFRKYADVADSYATDPKYPEKLIHLIELYELNELTFSKSLVKSGAVSKKKLFIEEDDTKVAFVEPENEQVEDYPMPPMEDLELFHNHRSGRRNGVRYIIAGSTETFASLALFLNMRERTLRKYNDALDTRELKDGDIVYIYPKKNRAERRYPTYYFRGDDTAWDIAQRYGIKLKSLYELNGIPYGTPLTTQQRLDLR